MKTTPRESGFTAVELLITLFVAAAFLIAGYQLFNLIIKDGGQTRSESRAANVAYDYLRQYAATSTSIPCVASTPLTNAGITVAGLSAVTVTVVVSCLSGTVNSVSKVDVAISYNAPVQTLEYATFVSSTGDTGSADITNGLVAWWKFNGDANDSSGLGNNGTVVGAAQTTGQTSAPDTAYAFVASSPQQVINFNTPSSLGATTTITAWVRPTNYEAGQSTIVQGVNPLSYYVSLNTDGSLQTYRFGTNPPGYASSGTGTVPLNQWTHVAAVWDASSVKLYVNGILKTTVATTGVGLVGAQTIVGAETTARQFLGSIDDVRIYNRVLSSAEIASLYSGSAK